jgi:hypothetical protein
MSNIIALSIVSAMDVVEVMPHFTYKWAEENPKEFREILEQFGMDTRSGFETQTDVTHRTKLGRLVTCDRYVSNERIDKEWIQSGYASREAKDKSSGSKLLTDIYRQKGMVE